MLSKNRTKSRDAYREPKRKFPSGKTQTLSPVPFVLLLRAALQRNLLCHLLEVVIYIGRWWVNKRIAGRSSQLRILNYNLECVSPREHICKWPSVIFDSLIIFNNYAMTIANIWFTIRFNNCSTIIVSRPVWFTIRFHNCFMTIESYLITIRFHNCSDNN